MINSKREDAMTIRQDTGYEGGKKSLALNIKDSLQTLYEHPACPQLLHVVLSQVASWQERNETTLGVALRWSPDLCAALLVMGTRVRTNKNDTQPAGEEFLADFLSRRGTIASLIELSLPLEVPERVFGHAHVRRTPGDIPIVSAYAAVDLGEGQVKAARLALTGVWREQPQLVESVSRLVGNPLSDEAISTSAKAIAKETNPKDNYLGSAEYRREMAEVLTRRALTMCREAAK
jgi:carbon-monoxide dehydrogenase medium subunit